MPTSLSASDDFKTPSTANDQVKYQDIPGNAQQAGDVADKSHDIKKAERAMHDEFTQGRIDAGDTVSAAGAAPGGPTATRN